jgi:hypothetical protein
MISLSCIAASVCFTAAVIAAREGRYEAALVYLVLFVFNTVLAVLTERKIKKLDTVRHATVFALGDAVIRLRKEFDDQKGGETDEMQSCEQEAD